MTKRARAIIGPAARRAAGRARPEGDAAPAAAMGEDAGMKTPPDTRRSKGMMMIAAYRAERLAQRPVLRDSLHQSHLARRLGREGGQPAIEPAPAIPAEAPAGEAAPAAAPEAADPASVFASLVSLAGAGRGAAPPDAGGDAAGRARTEPAASPPPPGALPAATEPLLAAEPAAAASAPEARTPPIETQAPPDLGGPAIGAAPDSIPATAQTREPTPGQTTPDRTTPDRTTPDRTTPDQGESGPTTGYDPPLAEIGFGPGMLIRLSQLGLHTTADLARADAARLRAALGDISRLVDVETWINHARQSSRPAPS